MDPKASGQGLPENAYRQLKEGEVYKPIVPNDAPLPEVTGYSLFWGLFMRSFSLLLRLI